MSKELVLTSNELAENELFNKAITFAVDKHKNGLRKGTTIPYIIHPLEVLHILMLMGADKYLMAAGVLHDTVEDTDATLEDIKAKFGEDVATLVASHTEKDKALPWKIRKVIALEHLKRANKREQMLVLADKLSNMRAIARDYAKLQDKLWERFNRGKESQSWYYHEGATALAKLCEYEDTKALYKEFTDLVEKVFPSNDNVTPNENDTPKFSRNGYWVRYNLDNSVCGIIRVENEYDDHYYKNGKWVKSEKQRCLGMEEDWVKVDEEEAMRAMKELDRINQNTL